MSKLEYGTEESGEEILKAMLHTYRLLPDPSRLVVKVGENLKNLKIVGRFISAL